MVLPDQAGGRPRGRELEGPHLVVDMDLAEILHTEVRWAGALGSLLHNHPLGAGADKGQVAGEDAPPHLEPVPRAPGTCPPAPYHPLCVLRSSPSLTVEDLEVTFS